MNNGKGTNMLLAFALTNDASNTMASKKKVMTHIISNDMGVGC